MPRLHPITRRDLAVALIVVLIAALMRLSDPHRMEFFHDEAMLSMMAQELAHGQAFPLTGIVSSVGLPNSPMSVYILATPYALSDSPMVATLFIAALNVAGVGVLWWIAQRYFGATVALIAGLTYALSPWAVMYSRKIWAQDFHTPFFLVALALGLLGFVENRRWAQALCLPVLLVALQIHVAGWALLPVYFALVWVGRDRFSLGALAITGGLAVLVALPYSLGLAQALQSDPARLLTILSRSEIGGGVGLGDAPLTYAAWLATGTGIETWLAPNQTAELLANVPSFPWLWGLLGVAALVGALALLIEFRPLAPVIGVWLVAPLAVFTPTWTRVYPHYFVASLPVFALLTGIGVYALIRLYPARYRSLWRAVTLASVLVILLSHGLWWRGALRYVSENAITLGEGTSGYTTPLGVLEAVARATGDAADVLVISREPSPHFDADSARFQVLLRDRACVRTAPDRGMIVQPAGAFVAIIGEEAAPAPDSPYLRADALTTLPTRAGAPPYRVARHDARLPSPVAITDREPVRFANGVLLDGYALTEEGDIWLRWRLPPAPTRLLFAGQDHEYQVFIHLLDAAGARIAQVDARYWGGRHWCAGDTLYTVATPPASPADADALYIGFYRLPDVPGAGIRAVDVLDVLGNPAGQGVIVPVRPPGN